MTWKSIKTLIGDAAPLLGAAVGGPAGAVAGRVIASALGTDNTPEAVAAALKSDPDALLKIRQAEFDNAEKLAAIAAADRSDARQRHRHSRMPAAICCALTVMVSALGWMLFTAELPSGNAEIAYLLFGALVAKWGDSIAYWVGTTRGSAEKTGMIGK